MKKILVTGGLGYIGSHTVVALHHAGYRAVIADNLANSTLDVLDGIEKIIGYKPDFEKVDFRVKSEVENLLSRHSDLAGVIHFAAFKAVGESVEKPLAYYENNISALVYLLRGLQKRGISNFIFSSSCTVYGQADKLPVTEGAPVKQAESPYGNTKQIGEEIVRDSVNATDFKAIALRYFNPIGAHPSAHIGELPVGVPQNLVPFITQTAIGLRDKLSVFGNDYPTRDGSCIRDYIHVVDLAEAHMVAVGRLLQSRESKLYEVYNLGTGTGSTVFEVIDAFEKATSQKLPYTVAPRRPGDVVAAWADTQLASEKLGWKSKLTLEDALRDAWAWEQKIRKK